MAFGNVLRPTINELFQRAPQINPAAQFLVLDPKRDGPFSDVGDTTLSDGWPPYVAPGVSQKMLFGLEGLDLDAPPAIFLSGEDLFCLFNGHVRMKLTRSQRRAEKSEHGPAPGLHQRVTFIVDARDPGAGRNTQPSP